MSYLPDRPSPAGYRADKPFLNDHNNEKFASFSMSILDQVRADIWIDELQQFDRDGKMPALEIIRLPNDHTSGLRAGERTPLAFMADNDLALGRMVEGLSKTRFWESTAMFVLE